MASSFGELLKIQIFGESHAKCVGMTIDGLPAGIRIDDSYISSEVQKRKPQENISTNRHEEDKVEFLSGVFNGFTNGDPVTFVINNQNYNSSAYVHGDIRPSHADFPVYVKSNGFNDYRGGGFTSGRLTAPIVILGAICKQILADRNISIASHIKAIHGISDDNFDAKKISQQIDLLNKKPFATISDTIEDVMKQEILNAKNNNDSVGGTIETVIHGLPIGLGEPYFDSFESVLSHLILSIGGVKGILFGDGIDFANKYGSEVSDEMTYEGNKASYLANHNGGILGGLTNGNNVIFTTIIKPTPSISKTQKSINVVDKKDINLNIKGDHDPCIVPRVRSVIDALTAYCVVEFLMREQSKHI